MPQGFNKYGASSKMYFWVKYMEFNPLLHKYCWNEPGFDPSFCQRELYRQLLALAKAFIPEIQRPLQLQMLQIITEKEVLLLNYVNFFTFNTSIILLKNVNSLYTITHLWRENILDHASQHVKTYNLFYNRSEIVTLLCSNWKWLIIK